MQVTQMIPEMLLAAGVLAVGVPAVATPAFEAAAPVAESSVQFVNNTEATASVSANGAVLFAAVEAGKTTEWSAISDSAVTFTMTVEGKEGQSGTITQITEEGARYTLTGAVGEDGRPALTIAKEEVPPTGSDTDSDG